MLKPSNYDSGVVVGGDQGVPEGDDPGGQLPAAGLQADPQRGQPGGSQDWGR